MALEIFTDSTEAAVPLFSNIDELGVTIVVASALVRGVFENERTDYKADVELTDRCFQRSCNWQAIHQKLGDDHCEIFDVLVNVIEINFGIVTLFSFGREVHDIE